MSLFRSIFAKGTLHSQLAWLLVLVAFAYPNGSTPIDLLAPQATQSDSKSDTDDETSKEADASKIASSLRSASRRLRQVRRSVERRGSLRCARASGASLPALRLDSLVGSGIRQVC
jgi:hypothetical protein